MKLRVRVIASWIATLLALMVFLFACFGAASDAQGAIMFLFFGPLVLMLLVIAWALARAQRRREPETGAVAAWAALGTLAFVVVFFVSLFVPFLNGFPNAVIGAVAAAYEAATGQTPYEATHVAPPRS